MVMFPITKPPRFEETGRFSPTSVFQESDGLRPLPQAAAGPSGQMPAGLLTVSLSPLFESPE